MSLFERAFNFIGKNKIIVFTALAVLTGLVGVGLSKARFDSDVFLMLPQDPGLQRDIEFLRESNFSDTVAVSLGLEDAGRTLEELVSAGDVFQGALGAPLVTSVKGSLPQTDILADLAVFMRYLPQTFDSSDIEDLGSKINADYIRQRLGAVWRQALMPSVSLAMSFSRIDPLGLSARFFKTVQRLHSSLGYDVSVKENHLVSKDDRHLLYILQTPIRMTDVAGSRRLLEYLKQKTSALPGYVKALIVCGHNHSVSNEDIIKKDIFFTSAAVSVVFLAVFLIFFRDWRAVLMFFMPAVAVVFAAAICAVFWGRLSYFIVGLGAVIVGIADDYGIHVYSTVRQRGPAASSIAPLVKPLISAALITCSVFASFFLSAVKGYHELAMFAIISIIICLVFSIFLLPHILKRSDAALEEKDAPAPLKKPKGDFFRVLIWLAFMAVCLAGIKNFHFSGDVLLLDGSSAGVLADEKKFHDIWGGKNKPALLVATGSSEDQALAVNARLGRLAAASIGEGFIGLDYLLPSQDVRQQNYRRWEEFWRSGRADQLRVFIKNEGRRFGFSSAAFMQFFGGLYSDKNAYEQAREQPLFKNLCERFIYEKDGSWQVLSFFPDEEKYVGRVANLLVGVPGSFLVSGKSISKKISATVNSEIARLSVASLVFMVILLLICFRSIKLAVLAFIPVASGLAALVGLLPFFGVSFNAPAVIAALVVVGLNIDYGIFMVYTAKAELYPETLRATFLSAFTTVAGAASLLLAKHPVLYSIGFTLVSGLAFGCLAAILIVPAMYRLWFIKVPKIQSA